MKLNEGDNYTFNKLDITPDVDFNGVLEISITVNDGQDESNQFMLEVEVMPVNDIPTITGTASELTTPEGTPLTLTINDLIIEDPDNVFPDDFVLTVFDGQNYLVSDNEITPVTDFVGVLSVLISVSDGEDESDQTAIELEVTKILSTMDGVSEQTFSIFPNPFANQLYIESSGRYNHFIIEVTNLSGQKIMILESTKIASYIDLSSIQDGIYLLKISDQGEMILTQKVIKQSR
ncbi:MAG: T9SS type A sorting domain-containing protein, partial [Ekhidna sp.]